MPRARQRSDDESSSPSRGGSAVGPQEPVGRQGPAAAKPDDHEEGKLSATLRKKTTTLSRRTGARRTQEEVAEANLDPPSNYTAGPKAENFHEWRPAIHGPQVLSRKAGVFPGYHLFIRRSVSGGTGSVCPRIDATAAVPLGPSQRFCRLLTFDTRCLCGSSGCKQSRGVGPTERLTTRWPDGCREPGGLMHDLRALGRSEGFCSLCHPS